MSMMKTHPNTPEHLLKLSRALTIFVAYYDLTPKRDVVVYCFDASEPDWKLDPAAWFDPCANRIVVNLGTVWKSIANKLVPNDLGELSTAYSQYFSCDETGAYTLSTSCIDNIVHVIESFTSRADLRATARSTHPIIETHSYLEYVLSLKDVVFPEKIHYIIARTLIAVMLHETGHVAFSQCVIGPKGPMTWCKSFSKYEMQVLMVLEELRCERQQIARIGTGREILRYAADVVVSPESIVESMKDSGNERGVSAASFALHASLCLGRAQYGIFSEDEVNDLITFSESILGRDRLSAAQEIWNRYSTIHDSSPNDMEKCIRDWVKLFPEPKNDDISVAQAPISRTREENGFGVASRDEKTRDATDTSSDDDESSRSESGDSNDDFVDFSGIYDEFSEKIGQTVRTAETSPDIEDVSTKISNARDAYRSSFSISDILEHTDERVNDLIKFSTPDQQDYQLVTTLVRDIIDARLSARSKIKTKTSTPPGRVDMRTALQMKADIAAGRRSQREPFERRTFKTQPNPEITVAVLTDVSSSHRWAERFNARMTFIICSAVKRLNGRAAALTFGERVTVVLTPAERPSRLVTIAARDGVEEFDQACGAADHLLRLSQSSQSGVRVMFVITDGMMVKRFEMSKTAAWVKKLTKAGCIVVWISPFGAEYETTDGMSLLPEGATLLRVDSTEVQRDPTSAVEAIAALLKRRVIEAIYG